MVGTVRLEHVALLLLQCDHAKDGLAQTAELRHNTPCEVAGISCAWFLHARPECNADGHWRRHKDTIFHLIFGGGGGAKRVHSQL